MTLTWTVLYSVIWNLSIKTCAFLLRKSLKDWYIVYKLLLHTWGILLFLLCGNGFEFHWMPWKKSLKEVELRKAPGYNCVLRHGTTHSVFVLMLIWEHLPSSSSRLCLLPSSFFPWFSHFLKLPYACFKKL